MGNLNILSKAALRQFEKTKTKVKGRKVVTEDINLLKSLAVAPMIPADDITNYYVEPITIEYYIPKESRFAYETKYLYIELDDPLPRNDNQRKIFSYFRQENKPIDVIEVMDKFPEFMVDILEYYNPVLGLYDSMSIHLRDGLSGNPEAIRRVLYLNEVLRKREPTIPALEIIGDYTTFNINWCIRFLNRHKIDHSLEDRTVAYLIKLHCLKYEREGREIDERFEILSEIYMEQAFPEIDDEDLLE
ncbi:MAG: hypothetical protein D6767_00615 [Candidatus Hydrogenedentota bacterium]|nr:MAG: hypothetical protein D6767_00615 [Candidatus Hydrogenedentota bacterium]